MRIIHFSPGIILTLGGVVRAVLDLCESLAARGHDITLATYDSPDIPSHWNRVPGAPRVLAVEPARRPNGFLPASALVQMRQFMRESPCVVHLHTAWAASNMQVARIARESNVPYVVSPHGGLTDWPMQQRVLKKRLYLLLGGRRYLQAAGALHYTAERERQQSEKWVPRAKSEVIPCLLDLQPFRSPPGPQMARSLYPQLDGGRPVLLFLSRLHEKKGVDRLIEAAAILQRENVPFQLIIAGTGDPEYEQQLRRQVASHQLGDRVSFIGFVSGVEKISLYEAADLFVLPTHHENFGMVLIESLAVGTPILTTRGTDIWEELRDAGAIISDVNPIPLAASIKDALRDLPALKSRGERGRAWVMEHLEMNQIAERYEAMYARLLGRAAAPATPG